MYKKLNTVIVKHPNESFISQEHLKKEWEKFNYIHEPDFSKAQQEFEQFLSIIKQHVDHIEFLPASERVGLDSLYAHDPVKFTKKGAIILKSGKKLRQPEAEVYKQFLIEKDIPILGELTGEAVADGGDLVWLDDRTLLIGRGYRTNDEAIRQIKEITKGLVDECIVVQLPHDQGEDECLHLMSFISIVDENLAVVYSRLMPVFLRQMLIKRGFELIEVPDEEYHRLGCNVLALAPRICMIVSGSPYTKQKLMDAGANVYEYEGNEISYLGTGGPTCLTCPVIRT
ncbi:amidinotransferase [Bacillus sp. ISL-40]|uniref:dimethylarginine dimethylaminohydrolase family protein n=1 Tax=unclassified Bacillus (in: firmicutes) TaxID=185979 RepID=UPI001BEA33CD|nr:MULTISPECIES: arginine deiminase family protein [unclassified Bacillus (in: firmicutes)]MBT2699568.1 amidinotransferase [Bacillus sp. ISL-40]MBT2724121.1 amidinotransferase [Bacillus sp. ISL-46]MBT2741150.1 amidinotransferase [Bacillus sp. ISL-77]